MVKFFVSGTYSFTMMGGRLSAGGQTVEKYFDGVIEVDLQPGAINDNEQIREAISSKFQISEKSIKIQCLTVLP